MRYKRPTDAECVDILDDNEVMLLNLRRKRFNGGNPAMQAAREQAARRLFNHLARRKAWREHRERGPAGQLQSLTIDHVIGGSVLLRGYTHSRQVAPIAAHVSRLTTARFKCSVERHDLSGEPIGVRVTLVGFGAPSDSSRES
jgi:hypothetical protein